MKISNTVIARISDRKIIMELALALDFTEQWMRRVVETNKENGPLTTAKALQVIRETTGLTDEHILEAEPVSK